MKAAKKESPCVPSSYPPVGLEGVPDYPVMIAQRAGVSVIAKSTQERRGALNVGEEEGQCLD